MEVVDSLLELSKKRQDKLSAIFALEWKRIEDGMNSTRGSLKELSVKIAKQKADTDYAERKLEAKSHRLVEMENEVDASVEAKRLELDQIDRLVQKKLKEFVKETERYEEIKVSTRDEESKLERVRASVSEGSAKLASLERSIGERSRDLDSAQRRLRNIEAILELKKKDVIAFQSKFEEGSEELKQRDRDIEAREKSLALVRQELERCSRELEARKKKLDLMTVTRQATNDRLEVFSLELKAKEKRAENLSSELEKLGSKFEEIDGILLMKLESNGKSFASLEHPVLKLFQELKEKETQLELRKTEIKTEPCDTIQTPVVSRPCLANRGAHNAWSEYVHKLIEKKEIILAVGVISRLKLTNEFPPVDLLTKYLDDSRNHTKMVCSEGYITEESKKTVMNKEVAVLRDVLNCAKEHNLEISIEELENRIGFLEESVRRSIRIAGDQPRYKIKYSTSTGVSKKAPPLSKRPRFFLE